MPLTEFRKKVAAIYSFDIVKETMEIIREYSDDIIQLIRGQMAVKGTNALGKPLKAKYGAFYRDFTVFNKERHGFGLGKETGHVTLFMTGDFYSSLSMEILGTTFNVLSSVPYFDEINSWNDGMLLNLDKENLLYLRNEIIIPELKARFKAQSQ